MGKVKPSYNDFWSLLDWNMLTFIDHHPYTDHYARNKSTASPRDLFLERIEMLSRRLVTVQNSLLLKFKSKQNSPSPQAFFLWGISDKNPETLQRPGIRNPNYIASIPHFRSGCAKHKIPLQFPLVMRGSSLCSDRSSQHALGWRPARLVAQELSLLPVVLPARGTAHLLHPSEHGEGSTGRTTFLVSPACWKQTGTASVFPSPSLEPSCWHLKGHVYNYTFWAILSWG